MTSERAKGASYNASHIILLHDRPNEDDVCMLNNSDATDDYEKNADSYGFYNKVRILNMILSLIYIIANKSLHFSLDVIVFYLNKLLLILILSVKCTNYLNWTVGFVTLAWRRTVPNRWLWHVYRWFRVVCISSGRRERHQQWRWWQQHGQRHAPSTVDRFFVNRVYDRDLIKPAGILLYPLRAICKVAKYYWYLNWLSSYIRRFIISYI